MRKKSKYILLFTVFTILIVISCKKVKEAEKSDTILKGKTSVLVDETLTPIVEDQVQVFENSYNAKINIIPQSEKECILSLASGKSDIAVLPRKLTKEESTYFKNKKIIPRETVFATDAIALIANSHIKDTLIDLKQLIDFVNSKNSKIKGLVFDNPNSSTVRYIQEISGIDKLPTKGIYSFNSNEKVIKYVAENEGMIGVIGVNWLSQPNAEIKKNIDKIKVLSVKGLNENKYYYPSQDEIASQKYPLARDLYIIDCQGYNGLGIGLSSFFAGQIGQRIILTSGLVPIRTPGRNLIIRNQIETK